ncbi:unnamed protein product, partial [marine sediment metagenome]
LILKNICKYHEIRGYSGKNKSLVSDLIVSNLTKKQVEKLLTDLSEEVDDIKSSKTWRQKMFRDNLWTITQSDKILRGVLLFLKTREGVYGDNLNFLNGLPC